MKRKISFIVALIASVMLVAISCSNASNITYSSNFTKDGRSEVTIKFGDTFGGRTILPEDWNDPRKGKLIYRLNCTDLGDSPNDPIEKDFTYEEISKNNAKIVLAPIDTWQFVLTAYQKLEGGAIDTGKPVLTATVGAKSGVGQIKLSTGSQDVTFNLVSSKDPAALGDVDIAISFKQQQDAIVTKVTYDIVQLSDLKTSVIKESKYDSFKTATIDNAVVGQTINTKFSVGYDPASATVGTTTPGIPAGDYMFKATFWGTNAATGLDVIRAQYMSTIRIDGGNISKATINIPEGSFNSAPTKPANLKAETYFEPAATKITLDEGKKSYAQETDTEPVSNTKNYRVKFTWDDTSFNETGFILKFNLNGVAKTLSYSNGAVTGTDVDVTVPADIEGATGNNGKLSPDCNSITIEVPTGKFIDNVTVSATNSFGTTASDPLVITNTKLGIYTVTYDLSTPDGSNAVVTTGLISTNSKYFVQPFEYNGTPANDKLLTISTSESLHVKSDKYSFGGWYLSNDGTFANKKENLDGFGYKDTVVKGKWDTEGTIKVNYPGYTSYKDIRTSDQAENTIAVPSETGELTFNLPKLENGDTITGVKIYLIKPSVADPELVATKSNYFTLTNCGDEETINGAKFVWNITEYMKTSPTPEYGKYTVVISYNYTKTGTSDAVPVSGNIYVNIANTSN